MVICVQRIHSRLQDAVNLSSATYGALILQTAAIAQRREGVLTVRWD